MDLEKYRRFMLGSALSMAAVFGGVLTKPEDYANWEPKEPDDEGFLREAGVYELPEEQRDVVLQLFWNAKHYKDGNQVSNSDSPVPGANAYVAEVGGGKIYRPEDNWASVDESREVFARQLAEGLGAVACNPAYDNLPEGVAGIVDEARQILDRHGQFRHMETEDGIPYVIAMPNPVAEGPGIAGGIDPKVFEPSFRDEVIPGASQIVPGYRLEDILGKPDKPGE